MKKFASALSCCFVLAVIVFSLIMSGCSSKFDSFIAGEYVSTNEVENDMISKIRLELHHIDKQTYSEAIGVNVVWDFTKSGADQYFSFELYLYVDELEEYCKIDLTNFEHLSHSPTYFCDPVDENASYDISGITFWFTIGAYDTWFEVWFNQNGMEYGYKALLVENIE